MDTPVKNVWMVETNDGAGKEKKAFWTKVGIALPNRDGSWSLRLSAIPLSGELVVRDALPVPVKNPGVFQ